MLPRSKLHVLRDIKTPVRPRCHGARRLPRTGRARARAPPAPLNFKQHHVMLNHEPIVRSGPEAKRRCGTRSMLFAGRRHSCRQTSNTTVRALSRYTKLYIARSTYTRATHYMYTVSVRAVLAIPHRPFMPFWGEPATITAPISAPCHLVVVAGKV